MNLRAEVIQDRYRVPPSQKSPRKMCPNETRAAGDEYLQVAIAFFDSSNPGTFSQERVEA